ncbi:MAG: helix-hairpin-helix domain-containing protein [Candidatus Omnitrophica bacterium]|nr:helix-hairpin-helix domain-containing protein [Candidatus Omnitrophota bacterium]
MISCINGKVVEKQDNRLVLDVGGMWYEVLIPAAVMQRLDESIRPDGTLTLRTFHYLQVEPAKNVPVLIGFLNDVEKDFFLTFITVSGIGPRAAVRALNKPISEIARAIDEADVKFLRSLPGIGEQRAREVVAKLQNKVGKFGLLKDGALMRKEAPDAPDLTEEALSVLMQLEYRKGEAAAMIKRALEESPGIQSTEELLNVVYRQKKAA